MYSSASLIVDLAKEFHNVDKYRVCKTEALGDLVSDGWKILATAQMKTLGAVGTDTFCFVLVKP